VQATGISDVQGANAVGDRGSAHTAKDLYLLGDFTREQCGPSVFQSDHVLVAYGTELLVVVA
jgi:hypothetical protein